MNNETVKGKWMEVKGEFLNKWGKITSDEYDETKGNVASIIGLIEQRYGEAKEAISDKIHEMFGSAKEHVEDAKEDAGRAIADASEDLKSNVRDATKDADSLN